MLAVVQELDLSSNQLEGPIPEGWRLPQNLTVSMGSFSLLRMLLRCTVHCASTPPLSLQIPSKENSVKGWVEVEVRGHGDCVSVMGWAVTSIYVM